MQVKEWITLIVLLLMMAGCGVMGPPVPPNSIGVNVKRETDKKERIEREQRLQDARKRHDRGEREQKPPGPAEQTPSPSEDVLLQDEIVQPAARPGDSDFLVRPR
jgi:predicted small lipoprotein YifL